MISRLTISNFTSNFLFSTKPSLSFLVNNKRNLHLHMPLLGSGAHHNNDEPSDKLKDILSDFKEKESDIESEDLSRYIMGPGSSDPSKVPTDLEISAGYERIQLLCELEGRNFFDFAPLVITHRGTLKNPVYVDSRTPKKTIACTGYPPESHDVIWLQVDESHKDDRCVECGCVFKMRRVAQPPLPLGARLGEPFPKPEDYL